MKKTMKKLANKMARQEPKNKKEGMDEDERMVSKHLNHDIKEAKKGIQEDKELKRIMKK